MMEWISVKTKHFADIKQTKYGYEWTSSLIDTPFVVAVPTNNGWVMQQVVLTNEIGLQCHTDDDGATYFGWDITDVTHWMEIKPPTT